MKVVGKGRKYVKLSKSTAIKDDGVLNNIFKKMHFNDVVKGLNFFKFCFNIYII